MPTLIDQLAGIAAAVPIGSVRFVAREVPFARETLRELARARGVLVGWEGTTLRQLADDFATETLDRDGFTRADDLQLQAAADDALDQTVSGFPDPLKRQVTSLGFRTAVFDACGELRMAGVTAAELALSARPGSPAHYLVPTYERYCGLLVEQRLCDAAEAFRRATDRAEHRGLAGATLVIEAGAADVTGLPRAFVEALTSQGAQLLTAPDAPPVWEQCTVPRHFYRSATPTLEVREALRRALADGLSWDQVELAVTDLDTYGSALASIGDQLGIPYTLKEGVPMARSRAGRALFRYLRWLEQGLPASVIRESLELGELPILATDVAAADVARALRSAQIGWGTERWARARERFADGSWVQSRLESRELRDDPTDREELAARLERTAHAAAGLIDLLADLMPAVPLPGATDAKAVQGTTDDLARRALGWIRLIAPTLGGTGEQHALDRVSGRLEALAAHERPRVPFALAMAELRQGIADLRAFPSADGARSGRVSVPGAVHLTHISQAGVTGRPRVHLMGLDADRVSTDIGGDPLLDEETRAALPGKLPTLHQRVERRQRGMHRALNMLDRECWFSYATLADGAGREASPAPLLLGAARASFGRPTMTYDELRTTMGAPTGAATGAGALDARDLWLGALVGDSGLVDGRTQIRELWPSLHRGLTLHAGAESNAVTEWHGQVPDAAGMLGPLASAARGISPSSLELLAKCPLAWFYRYGLELAPPEDVEFDATLWLDPAQRGSLLHSVFERFVTAWMSRQDDISSPDADVELGRILSEEIARELQVTPAPSTVVLAAERELLERLTRNFLAQERAYHDAEWVAVEVAFPRRDQATTFRSADGLELPIHGRIDRVDRFADGSLRIIDYKTGSSGRFRVGSKDAPLKGGRMLQPALYAAGASQALGAPVQEFEYRFPKERTLFDRVRLTRADIARAPAIVSSLLAHPRSGSFVPTDDPDDCVYCDFRDICRVNGDRRDITSPRADWGKAHGESAPEYVQMRARRGGEKVEGSE